MATPQYIKDFNDKFEQPYVAGITVGFSTIDPQQKTIFDAADYDYSKLTPAQQKVIQQMIASYVSKLSIRIDSGNINPAAPEPEPQLEPISQLEPDPESIPDPEPSSEPEPDVEPTILDKWRTWLNGFVKTVTE